MKKIILTCLVTVTIFSANAQADSSKIRVLLIDGQNNHAWEKTSPQLKLILEDAGLFTVDITTTPAGPQRARRLSKKATAEEKKEHEKAVKQLKRNEQARKKKAPQLWAAWRPNFEDYDVVVSNYNGEDWPEAVQEEFVEFVRNGGGFVSYHAADNSFSKWEEYNQMIALGGWGGRKEAAGPYLKLVDGAWTPVDEPGSCGGHGPRAEFIVNNFAPEHPIMQGLPAKWMHTQDELYHSLRGPAENVSVIGSGFSKATKEEQPLLMAIDFGKGRVFHTTLGHYLEALDGLGFQVTFTRGTEWAATGKVTIPAPKPGELTADKAAVRKL